ncbi:LytTR family DNA-binding domain-containing protein [Flagellimonas flava]|uniref:LytTr DNA-binding domain-containing protein n=1 Tax=Flagellimonas flava TaxID=570519 RepID=A0A1M5M6Y0_9FLAO|nr:LytTR family DNA-binding domain-containing protein [Allomuricauda flava]SHG73041.1 LytTr DNA-binding domain-containing protein [Allomuricauda flava]
MKIRNFTGLIIVIASILGLLIYWREYATRDQVEVYQVVLWQVGIWMPWLLGFMALQGLEKWSRNIKNNLFLLITASLILIVLHFGWFFWLSSNASPYLHLEGSKFGVYRYFFIFWTFIDLGLVWFIIDKLKTSEHEKQDPPLLLELTRGGNTVFCEPSQIHLLAAENYYTKLFTSEGVFVMRRPLKSFLEVLPDRTFQKIHRSTIINLEQVSELARGNGSTLEVVMKDGTRKRVSKNYIKEVKRFFKDRTY